jgi:ribosomal protein L44E
VRTLKKIAVPILAAAATWGFTSLVMKAVFASQPGGLRDFGACLGVLFWLGLPIVVLVQTAKACNRSQESETEREEGRSDFAGCLLLVAIAVGLWMVVVSWSEGWSSGPLYFTAVIVAIPALWLTVSLLAAKGRERRRIRENALQEKLRREEIEYANTHCPVCKATDIESKTHESTYETTEAQIEREDRYDREGRYIGHSEHERWVPTTKRKYWTWLTCTKCGKGWPKE